MKNPSPSGERAGAARGAPGLPRRRVVLLAWCLLCALPAYAERADRTKPLNLEADRMTVEEAKQTATFEGNVILTQGTLTIRGARMIVQQDAGGFKHGAAYGNLASFRQKREGFDEYIEGYAERIEYDGKADKLQMFNRAYLKKNNDEVRGNYISYDTRTEVFRVQGGKRFAPSPAREDRVRAVIQPKAKPGSAPRSAPLELKSAPGLDPSGG